MGRKERVFPQCPVRRTAPGRVLALTKGGNGMGTTFHIGERVVYPLHGLGRIDRLLTRVVAGTPQHFYQIVLEKPGGTVLVPVSAARA